MGVGLSICDAVYAPLTRRKSSSLGEFLKTTPSVIYKEDGHCIATFFTNSAGLQLCYYAWEIPNPKGVVLASHGLGVHARWEFLSHPGTKYEGSFVERLNSIGCSVYAIDHQSHGESDGWEGVRCNVCTFSNFVDDFCSFSTHVAAHLEDKGHEPLPVFVVGCSMGAAVACFATAKSGIPNQKGLLTLAGMLSVDAMRQKPLNRAMMCVGKAASLVTPHFPAVARERNPNLPEMQNEMDTDPLTYKGNIRALLSMECVAAVDRIPEIAEDISVPLFCLHGASDVFTEPKGTERFFNLAKVADKRLLLMEDLNHAVLHEPKRDLVMQEICDWLVPRLAEESDPRP